MTAEEILQEKNIAYTYSGRDLLVSCFNPEHNDSHPSMRIDKITGIYNCFVCGFKGTIFQYFDIPGDKVSILREKILRKIEDTRMDSIGLEMLPNSHPVTSAFRVSLETLLEFEAFKSANKDYGERVWFPITGMKDKVLCFIGRTEDPFKTPKYKFYPSGCKVPLFPLTKVRPHHGRVMLVEGIFDMLNLYDHGFRNVLCVFGAAKRVTKEKLSLLRILGVTGIDICFDSDKAGQSAAEEAKKLAEKELFRVRNIVLKEGDPGDLSPTSAKRLKEKLYNE
jgi:DNA primase